MFFFVYHQSSSIALICFFVFQIVTLYEIITIPFYYYIQKPWKRQEAAASARARQVDAGSPYNAWKRTIQPPKSLIGGCDNVTQLFERVVTTYGNKKAFGYRPILDESGVVQANGRVFVKRLFSDTYIWLNYNEMYQRVNNLASGLLQQGKRHALLITPPPETTHYKMCNFLYRN